MKPLNTPPITTTKPTPASTRPVPGSARANLVLLFAGYLRYLPPDLRDAVLRNMPEVVAKPARGRGRRGA